MIPNRDRRKLEKKLKQLENRLIKSDNMFKIACIET